MVKVRGIRIEDYILPAKQRRKERASERVKKILYGSRQLSDFGKQLKAAGRLIIVRDINAAIRAVRQARA